MKKYIPLLSSVIFLLLFGGLFPNELRDKAPILYLLGAFFVTIGIYVLVDETFETK